MGTKSLVGPSKCLCIKTVCHFLIASSVKKWCEGKEVSGQLQKRNIYLITEKPENKTTNAYLFRIMYFEIIKLTFEL